jgi:hypothetical protein
MEQDFCIQLDEGFCVWQLELSGFFRRRESSRSRVELLFLSGLYLHVRQRWAELDADVGSCELVERHRVVCEWHEAGSSGGRQYLHVGGRRSELENLFGRV